MLAFTPGPGGAGITPAADVTARTVAGRFALHVLGAVTAVRHVLPGMLARGTGTVLLTTGASSVVPIPALGDLGIAMAGLRNWALGLHAALAPSGCTSPGSRSPPLARRTRPGRHRVGRPDVRVEPGHHRPRRPPRRPDPVEGLPGGEPRTRRP